MDYAEFILVPKSEQAQLVAMLKHYQQLQQARLDEQAREAWEKDRCVVSGPFPDPIKCAIGAIENASNITLPQVFEFMAADGGIIHLCAWTEAHARAEIERTPWLAGRGPLEFNASWVEWPGMGIQTPDAPTVPDGSEIYYQDGA